ncbi:MAG: glycosyltransferase family 39 protein [Chloroflexi bacterium]|nr:glycosyltransferase family 39 protein [Chloroflexota bacterium]
MIIVFLIAFFFRTHELAGLGLGLEHDEVAEWQIADGIRHGQHALFFKEAYGQEPLFLYLMAGSTALIGDSVIGVRFPSVFVAMLTLAATYRLLRRMLSPTVALVAVAFMAIALWPVFWGRVALRAMTLPLMLALGFDWLWRGLTAESKIEGKRDSEKERFSQSHRLSISPSLRPFVLAGLFFGISAYTYLSSRALPILLVAFTVYLVLFARDRMRGKWRGLFAGYLIGGLIALPLAITLLTNPDLQFRVSEVSGPLDKAIQGDWSEVGANVNRTLGMFTVKGDSTVRDNWPDRPVFPEPIGALLFSAGALIAITRLRQPRYALALLWIGVMLIPTIVTTGAPNFTRTLGALPIVFAMPGIAVEWARFWLPRLVPVRNFQTMSRVVGVVAGIALIGVLGINAVSTYDDYFIKWPAHPETQFVFQADFAAIAKDIDASDVMDVSVGGLSNDTLDDPSLYLLRQRKDVRVRWFDSGSPISSGGAVVNVSSQHWPAPIYIPSIVPISEDMRSALDFFTRFPTSGIRRAHFDRFDPEYHLFDRSSCSQWEPYFEDTARLDTATPLRTLTVTVGSKLVFSTKWLAHNPIESRRRIFAHLIDPVTGQAIAQHDGLDAPAQFWQAGDEIVQGHSMLIPLDTKPGHYELWLGMYNPTTGQRVIQIDCTHTQPPSDHVVYRTVIVTH